MHLYVYVSAVVQEDVKHCIDVRTHFSHSASEFVGDAVKHSINVPRLFLGFPSSLGETSLNIHTGRRGRWKCETPRATSEMPPLRWQRWHYISILFINILGIWCSRKNSPYTILHLLDTSEQQLHYPSQRTVWLPKEVNNIFSEILASILNPFCDIQNKRFGHCNRHLVTPSQFNALIGKRCPLSCPLQTLSIRLWFHEGNIYIFRRVQKLHYIWQSWGLSHTQNLTVWPL